MIKHIIALTLYIAAGLLNMYLGANAFSLSVLLVIVGYNAQTGKYSEK